MFFLLAHRLVSYQGAVFASALPLDEEATVRESPELTASVAPPPEAGAMTREQLSAIFGAAPGIGQEVGLFEIGQVT
ncbi:MAG: hypothetical protein ACYCOU_25480 [Sulfobacillus sp.]